MLMSNDDVKQLMNDSYNWFFTKYRDMNLNKDSPEWDSIVSDINKLSKKYDRFHFTDEVVQQDGTIETISFNLLGEEERSSTDLSDDSTPFYEGSFTCSFEK